MTVGELLGKISAAELTDWQAYERITGPLGPERGDIQAAMIASTIANVNRGKGSRAFKLAEFIPKWDRPGPGAMRGMLISLTHHFGGKVGTGDG